MDPTNSLCALWTNTNAHGAEYIEPQHGSSCVLPLIAKKRWRCTKLYRKLGYVYREQSCALFSGVFDWWFARSIFPAACARARTFRESPRDCGAFLKNVQECWNALLKKAAKRLCRFTAETVDGAKFRSPESYIHYIICYWIKNGPTNSLDLPYTFHNWKLVTQDLES